MTMPVERVIVTDTAASISPKEAALIGVAMIPLHIHWPDKSQSLDTDFSGNPTGFYKRMEFYQKKGMGLPKTSAPSPGEFFKLYEQLRAQGAREIGSVHVTSKKSAVYNSALQGTELAKEKYLDLKIQVIDSYSVSLAQWFLVEKARKMMEEGQTLEEINNQIAHHTKNGDVVLYVAISSLRNLKESGRVGGAAALAASLLDISALVELKEGDVKLYGKERGVQKGRKAIIKKLKNDIIQKGLPTQVGVIYTRDEEILEDLKEVFDYMDEEESRSAFKVEAGSILGIHAGPGAGAVAAFWENKTASKI